jgi:SPP1 gp7 family putative phage head morphogenesis protein
VNVIPLAQMARDRGVRKNKRLRMIVPTGVLENDLLAIYVDSIKVWTDLAKRIAEAYETPAPVATDADGTQLQWLVDQAARQADNTILYQTDKLGKWVTKVGNWHGDKTIAAVKSALGVDIAPFIRLSDVRELLDDSVRMNVALIRDVNAKTRTAVEQIIYDGLANRRSKKYVTDALADAMGITKKRARLIAGDQMHKLNIALTAYRNQQLGINSYIWHHTPQQHPRYEHIKRDGKRFSWSMPPADGPPGYAVNCKCKAEPIVEVE